MTTPADALRRLEAELASLRRELRAAEEERTRVGSIAEQYARQLETMRELLVSATEEQRRLVNEVRLGHQEVLRSEEDLRRLMYDLRHARVSTGDDTAERAYSGDIRRIREAIRTTVPTDATVLVISGGDEELVDLYGRRAVHFPGEDNGYAGYYPKSSTGAIAYLEVMRARGADYLLVPPASLWWLDHYIGFDRHIRQRYPIVLDDEETAVIFALKKAEARSALSLWEEIRSLIDECEDRLDRLPVILDWSSGLDLAAELPDLRVFSPLSNNGELPYLDDTIDVVAVSSAPTPDVRTEARRVARAAVVAPSSYGSDGYASITVDWKESTPRRAPTVSLLVSVDPSAADSNATLFALRETLQRDFTGQILIPGGGTLREAGADWARADARVDVVSTGEPSSLVEAYNALGQRATGEILIFLHGSTLVMPEWLQPLLRTFRLYPDAGAVTGRLVSPLGQLLHAGGVIFADGSVASIGHGDEAVDAMTYGFVRRVDYVSFALLATKRDLFSAANGFATDLVADHAVAADYCLRLRELGSRSYYQPESTAVLLQHARKLITAETETADDLVGRWGAKLYRQPEPPDPLFQSYWRTLPFGDYLEDEEE